MLLVEITLRNTGIGHLWKELCKDFLCTIHPLCVCVCVCVRERESQLLSHIRLFATPWLPGSFPWNSPGKSSGVSYHSLLQGIFPTQRLNPGLPHCRQILYQLSHQGIPYVLFASLSMFCQLHVLSVQMITWSLCSWIHRRKDFHSLFPKRQNDLVESRGLSSGSATL